MLGLLAIACNVYERSLTTTPGAFITNVGPRLSSYEHTITATGGFESCTLAFAAADLDEAALWADRLLCPVQCYGPDADLIWDGFISQVEVRVGSRVRAYSLDAMANRVRTRYTTFLGTGAVTTNGSSAASIAIYGVKDEVISLATLTLSGAEALRDAYLAARAFPRAAPQTTISTAGGGGTGVEITLTCSGWYYTLDHVLFEVADTSDATTSDQVAEMVGISAISIAGTNDFLSTYTGNIALSGATTTRRVEADTSYRAAIEQRLSLGDVNGQRYAWGVFDRERTLTVKQWAGAAPSTIGYRVRLADTQVISGTGAGVELWQVRPDAMVEDVDLVPVGPPPGSVDAGGAFYLERVAFRASGGSLELALEPEASSGLDARIARVS